MRRPRLVFEFPARYELTLLDRVERIDYELAFSFPSGLPLEPQQELGEVIVGVRPDKGSSWIGVLDAGSDGEGAAEDQLIGWPDEVSFCAVLGGEAYVVRTDGPSRASPIQAFPITGVLSLPERGLVLLSDFTDLIAYGAQGVVWHAGRLVWDDLTLIGAEGDRLIAAGYEAPSGRTIEFTVDLRSGASEGAPYPRP